MKKFILGAVVICESIFGCTPDLDPQLYVGVEYVMFDTTKIDPSQRLQKVSSRPTVRIRFTTRIDRNSISDTTVEFFEGLNFDNPIPSNVFFEDNDQTIVVRLNPSSQDLETNKLYSFVLSKYIKAYNGVSLTDNYSISFGIEEVSSQATLRITYNKVYLVSSNNDYILELPYNADLTAVPLTLNISHNAQLYINSQKMAVVNDSFSSTFNFLTTSKLTFKVVSENGLGYKLYTLSVTSSERVRKNITSFSFLPTNNPQLGETINCTISGNQIVGVLPVGTSKAGLLPTVIHEGNKIFPASNTRLDFTADVIYRVFDLDGLTKDYVVKISVASVN